MQSASPKERKSKLPSDLIFASKRAGKAIVDYQMLDEGDKVMVAVSGGKDSLSLLHILRHRQQVAPVHFSLIAVHIDYGMRGSPVEALRRYFEKKGFVYHIEKADFFKGKDWQDINCFLCSWNRRKTLFQLVEKLGCNKIALGHHMDDIVETILLNLFYHGEVGAMRPRQELFDGKVVLIRPLCYVRERSLKRVADKMGFLHIDQHPCPHNDDSKRAFVKSLVAQLEKNNKDVVKNIFTALENVKYEYLLNKPDPK